MEQLFARHRFMPGQTIDAAIKLKNRHDLTTEQMTTLRAAFNELNGNVVVRPGDQLKIPLQLPA